MMLNSIEEGGGKYYNNMSRISSFIEGNTIPLTLSEYKGLRTIRVCPILDHFYGFKVNCYWSAILNGKKMDLESFIYLLYLCGEIEHEYMGEDPKFKFEPSDYNNFITVNKINYSDILSLPSTATYSNCRDALISKYLTLAEMYDSYDVSIGILAKLYHDDIITREEILSVNNSQLVLCCGILDNKFLARSRTEMNSLVEQGVDIKNIIPNWDGEYNCLHPNYKLDAEDRVPYEGILIHYDIDDRYTASQLNECNRVEFGPVVDVDYRKFALSQLKK